VEYEQLLKQNEELTQITELTTIQLDPMTVETLRTAHQTLNNLVATFNATNLAITNSKNEVESLCKYFPLPKEEITETNQTNTLIEQTKQPF